MKHLITLLVIFYCGMAMAEGDVAKGKQTFVICAVCHGDHAQGNEDFEAPRLQGQHDWYLLTQLEKFKSEVRGGHDDDDGGQVMIGIVASLDEAAFENVVAYIGTLEPVKAESDE